MPVKEGTLKQYKAIRREYDRLSGIQEHGVQKYAEGWIIRKLAQHFFKSPSTIERILYHRV